MIQSGRSFGSWLGNLRKKALTNIVLPLARDNLPGLVSKLASNALNKFEKKISRKGAVITGKRFTLLRLCFFPFPTTRSSSTAVPAAQ